MTEGIIVPVTVTLNVPIIVVCCVVAPPAVTMEAGERLCTAVEPVSVAAVAVAPSIPKELYRTEARVAVPPPNIPNAELPDVEDIEE